MRIVLYLSAESCARLGEEARRRTQSAGVPVTREAAARSILYAGLGLSPEGNGELAPVYPGGVSEEDLSALRADLALLASSSLLGEQERVTRCQRGAKILARLLNRKGESE